ncbi:hypothetical protein Barb4_03748 [Bacteroidales bacterium Barb4]|nr:hypothetical protein Barb4_03748 [Bacteroidales bacterium Barb4]
MAMFTAVSLRKNACPVMAEATPEPAADPAAPETNPAPICAAFSMYPVFIPLETILPTCSLGYIPCDICPRALPMTFTVAFTAKAPAAAPKHPPTAPDRLSVRACIPVYGSWVIPAVDAPLATLPTVPETVPTMIFAAVMAAVASVLPIIPAAIAEPIPKVRAPAIIPITIPPAMAPPMAALESSPLGSIMLAGLPPAKR